MADSDSIKRSILLEKRIARLEKLIKNESIEFGDMDRVLCDLETVFYDHFANEDNYDSKEDFKNNIEYASNGDNDMMVDDAIMWLASDFNYDEADLEDLRDDIAGKIAEYATDVFDEEDWDEDEDWEDEDCDEDEEFESFRRNTSRTFRNESTKRRCRYRFHK